MDMKRFIMIVIFAMMAGLAYEANAQLVYEPFYYGNSSSSQGQRLRTTAYCYAGGGNYHKLPIVVETGRYGLYVTQYYQAPQSLVYGSDGRWVSISPVRVEMCYPDLANNRLEKSFMYKANIYGTMYYFDL